MKLRLVSPEDQLMVITRNGVVNRQRVDEIRTIGRATQGVRLVNLDEGDEVMDVARFLDDGEDELEHELQAAVETRRLCCAGLPVMATSRTKAVRKRKIVGMVRYS